MDLYNKEHKFNLDCLNTNIEIIYPVDDVYYLHNYLFSHLSFIYLFSIYHIGVNTKFTCKVNYYTSVFSRT